MLRDTDRAPSIAVPALADTPLAAPSSEGSPARPLVSLIMPAYNEAAIIEQNLTRVCAYLTTLEDRFACELLVIDDGSSDGTGEIVERFSKTHANVRLHRHITNFGLGQALKFGFNLCRNADYIVTLDADLSYEPPHIGILLDKIVETHARIVVASPYMKGGNVSNVPWSRRAASRWANRFLATAANARLTTLTGMVRAYDARFLRTLNFRAMGMEVNADIIRQAQILRARVVEVPAHLAWHETGSAPVRRSSIRLGPYTRDLLISTFLFRPVMVFVLPGVVASGAAVVAVTAGAPIVAAVLAVIAAQCVGLGALSLQTKRNFEDLFHLITAVYKHTKEGK